MEVGEWQLIKPKREDPGSRFLHTAVVWNDEMVVYGGFVGAVGRRGTWSLNLKDREWRQLSTDGEEPERREEHSAIMWQDEMIIFGGAGGGKHVCDTWALNLRSQKWKRLEPKGEVPKGRCRHSAVLWKDQMIVFGGFDGSSGLSDTWTLGLKLQEWTLLRPMGKLPGAHSGHSAVVLSDQMFVFGGHSGGASNNIWCLNFQAPEWMLLNITGDIPKPRHNHSAVLLGNHMIVFGGEGDHGFNETWSLDLTNNKWKMHSLGNLPTERSKHPAVVWQHEMVIFGGAGGGGGSMRNDTWSLRLVPPSSRTPLALATTPRRPTPRGDGLAPTPREEVGLAAAMGAVTDPMVEEACQAMATMPGNAEVQKWGLFTLTYSKGHERAAAEAKAAKLIVVAMKAHDKHPQIQDWGSVALAVFCAGADPESCQRKEEAMLEGALEVLVTATSMAKAKRAALGALGTLFCGEDAGRAERVRRVVQAGVPALLREALNDDDSSRTIRKVFSALAELAKAAPEELPAETIEFVERTLAAHSDYEEIQRLGQQILLAAPQRECPKENPTYWSGHISEEGWTACPVTGDTLNTLRKMFVVDQPGELGKGRDADSYPRKYNALRVHCAWRVEHQDCWESYVVERSKAQKTLRRLREKGMPVPPWQSKIQDVSKNLPGATYVHEAGERFLLHGCSPEVLLDILHNGFDDRVTKKGMFGAGCYFAEDPEKIDQYVRPDPHHNAPGLEELHSRLYTDGNSHPDGDVFYCVVARVVCGACIETKGLDRSAPTKDAASGQEIFVNGDLKQLVSIPGITPSVRYQTLLVNLASEGPLGRCVMRFREFVSFKGASCDLPGVLDCFCEGVDLMLKAPSGHEGELQTSLAKGCWWAEKNEETQLDYAALEDCGLQPKKALVVINYFNKQLPDLTSVSELNTYCRGYLKKFKEAYFVMLHYEDGINKENMNFEELYRYYSTLGEKEKATYQKQISELEAKDQDGLKVEHEVWTSLGVNAALDAMQQKLSSWMEENRKTVLSILKGKKEDLLCEVEKLEKALGPQGDEELRVALQEYNSEFQHAMKVVFEGDNNCSQSKPKQDSRYSKQYVWAFDTKEVSRTFEEEWVETYLRLRAELKDQSLFPDLEDLREKLKDTYTGNMLDMRLRPHAAFNRIMKVSSFVIMQYPMRTLTKQEMYSKSGHSNDGVTGSFNPHKVLKGMVTERLLDLQDIVEVVLEHIHNIYEAPVTRVHEMLTDRHTAVKCHPKFREKFTAKYQEILEQQLSQANQFLQRLINQTTACAPADLNTRLISLLGITPKSQAQDSSPERVEANASDVPERVGKHREAVKEVQKTVETWKGRFNVIDFVEGGCDDLPFGEYRSVDEKRLNDCAERIFLQLKGMIVLQLEGALNYDVYAFLQGKLLNDMHSEMAQWIRQLMDHAQELKEMLSGSEELKAQLRMKKEELSLCEEAFEKLDPTGAFESRCRQADRATLLAAQHAPKPAPLPVSQSKLLEGELDLGLKLSKLKGPWLCDLREAAEQDLLGDLNGRPQMVTVDSQVVGDRLRYWLTLKPDAEKETLERIEQAQTSGYPRAKAVYQKFTKGGPGDDSAPIAAPAPPPSGASQGRIWSRTP
ncbi:unnamed protein product [Durusdinium trenchii]|uniref:PARP catalytic domain-containing protein n=1 Tax=Durusdinium trenchii TaxID=1381693 RepID=A0ABP0K409_9DINO